MALRHTALYLTTEPPQTGRPASDVAVGTWETQAGGTTNLYAVIDESTASDSDYVVSSPSDTTDTELRVRVTALTDPNSSDDHVVRYRYGKDASGGATVNLRL